MNICNTRAWIDIFYVSCIGYCADSPFCNRNIEALLSSRDRYQPQLKTYMLLKVYFNGAKAVRSILLRLSLYFIL